MAVPEASQAPLVVSTASQYLAASVLHAFPNSALTDPTAGDQRDANPGPLRRAVAFIEANPDIDISISDIARAAYITPRALQLAFRRHRDTTPMEYLRRSALTTPTKTSPRRALATARQSPASATDGVSPAPAASPSTTGLPTARPPRHATELTGSPDTGETSSQPELRAKDGAHQVAVFAAMRTLVHCGRHRLDGRGIRDDHSG